MGFFGWLFGSNADSTQEIGISKKISHSQETLPQGTLRAPYWLLDKRENHGMGYHIHIKKLSSGSYVRTNAALTIKDGKVVIFFHNDGAQVDLKEKDMSDTFKADIKSQLTSSTFKIPPNEWRPVTKDKTIFLFNA
jgi:hypothetical protein